MEERIACGCGNAVYQPPAGRDYACPLCGRRLPRRDANGEFAAPWMDRVLRGSLVCGCLATILAVVWNLLLVPAPRAGVSVPSGPRAPYRSPEALRYRVRVRQLEEDLRVDPREYSLLVKLGALHLRLGVRQQDKAKRAADLEAARLFYQRAAVPGAAIMRREFEYAMLQLDRLAGRFPIEDAMNEPVPTPDPLGQSGPFPFLTDAEMALRVRLDYTRMRLAEQPDHSRLLCRLGWTCYRLAQAVRQRKDGSDARWFYESAGDEPTRLMQEAISALEKTVQVSRSREFRVQAYQGLADIYHTMGRRFDSLAMLQRIATLQPNNWPATDRMAAILRQLGRRNEAERALVASKSWRTPEWF